MPHLTRGFRRRPRRLLPWAGLALLMLLFSAGAQAIPAYARQTGSTCADCHAGSYGYTSGGANGPNLTPYGMQFKMNGYTDTDTDGQGFKLPLSAQVIAAHTAPAQGKGHSALTEADLYIAGRVSDNVGGFIKVENDHQGQGSHYQTKLSSLDLRFVVKDLKLAGKDTLLGVTVNNSPGFTDPVAILPGATYFGPPGSTGGTALNPLNTNGLASRVIGASVYTLFDKNWYGELGSYRDLPTSLRDRLGYHNDDPGRLSDTVYGRFAYMKDWKRQFFSAGLVGLTTKRQLPETAPSDTLTDLGYDLSYQYLGNRENIVQLSYVNIFEHRKYGSIFSANGFEALNRGVVHDQEIDATYTFKQQFGFQFGHLISTGTSDVARFGLTGPDTTVNSYTLFWTPFGRDESWLTLANLRLSLSWFRFTKLSGQTNFFLPPGVPGPRKPSDLDSVTAAASLAF